MVDVSRHLKRVRDELARFQQDLHAKTLEREKMMEEVRLAEQQIQQIHLLELELRKKRSLLGRMDIEIAHLTGQKKRLEREIPNMEREFQKMEMERTFGRKF